MNYSNLVKQTADSLGVSTSEADRFIKGFTKVVLDSLSNEDSVDVTGFGKFKKTIRKARMGVNPKDPSIKISIPESKALTFKQSSAIKKLFNS